MHLNNCDDGLHWKKWVDHRRHERNILNCSPKTPKESIALFSSRVAPGLGLCFVAFSIYRQLIDSFRRVFRRDFFFRSWFSFLFFSVFVIVMPIPCTIFDSNKVMFARKASTKKCVLFFLRGSVIPFPVGFCYRQVAILFLLLGITIIISPPYH
jgi:hypothetical protein